MLNRGVRIRGEGKVVEGLRVSGTDEVEAESRGWEKWYATGVAAVAVSEFGVKQRLLGEFGRMVAGKRSDELSITEDIGVATRSSEYHHRQSLSSTRMIW